MGYALSLIATESGQLTIVQTGANIHDGKFIRTSTRPGTNG